MDGPVRYENEMAEWESSPMHSGGMILSMIEVQLLRVRRELEEGEDMVSTDTGCIGGVLLLLAGEESSTMLRREQMSNFPE
jgi:hypothetical protein